MLETFRKHHYVLMLIIAIVVVISFTFLSNPSDRGGREGGGARVFTLYNRDVTISEVQLLEQEVGIANQLTALSQDRDGDPVAAFYQAMVSIVNKESPTDRTSVDLDPPKNILVMRHESERLGIEVEREDLEKFIKEIGAFKSNGGFDAKKLDDFLSPGPNGDRASTETKLFTTLRDVMRFQRLAQLIGGTFPPSKAEVDADYAAKNQKVTAATVLVGKKVYEEQAVTDEDIQKFYDGEKAKHETPAPPADPKKKGAPQPPVPPPPAADPIVLSEEKRTVKYIFTELAKPPTAPPPLQPLPPLGDVSKLPEDQKKAKEEEHKKQEEEFKKKEEEFKKANEEYQKKLTEHTATKNTWLKTVGDFSDALVSEERSGKSFEDIAKQFKFEPKTATFTKTTVPEDIKKVNPRADGGPAEIIFGAEKGPEEFMEAQDKSSYCFYSVTEIEKAALLPLDQVKQKITDKLKAEKVTAALKAAGESTRSNLLEALKGGKPFKDAVESARASLVETLKKEKTFKEADAATVLTSSEVPPFSKGKPAAPGPNSSVVATQAESLNAGEISTPQTVPDGLLLVYVEKKELPKHPDMEQQKKDMAKSRTYRDAIASVERTNQRDIQEMIARYTYLEKHGHINPVLKAWFTDSRNAAESVTD